MPPRLASWLLRRTLSPDRYETVAGDLEEIFQLDQLPHAGIVEARRWFWRQTFSILAMRCLQPRAYVPAALLAPPRKGDAMHGLRHDIRYAMRALAKTPGFTFIAILTLALGIGGTTAIFTLVNALLLKPLPFKDPAQLMMVHIKAPDPRAGAGIYRDMVWSYPKYQLFKASRHAFQDSAIFTVNECTVTGSQGEPERVRGEIIDSRYLPVLGIAPQLGRGVLAEEDATPGIAPLALISQALWQRRFGSDPAVIGQTVALNAVPHTIIGIMPAGFRGLTGQADVWIPLMSSSNRGYLQDLNQPQSHSYYLVARRAAEATEEQAKSEAALIGERVNAQYPPPPFAGKIPFGAYAVSLDDARLDPLMRRAVFVLMGAVCAVLLIGCVNLANLMLARSLTRQREVAIRLAIGATRGRVVRQFLTESVVLAGAGGAAGVLVAFAAMKLAAVLMPETGIVLPRGTGALITRVGIAMIDLDWTTLLFALATAGVTALLFGLLPAWQASRSDVTHVINAGGAGSIGRGTRGSSARTLLIIGETALALVLLVAAGLMIRSVRNLQSTGLGFDPNGLTTMQIALPDEHYDAAHSVIFFSQLLERLRAQPGVQAVAYGNCAPVSGGCNGTMATFPDRPMAPGTEPDVQLEWVSPGYFETMGIRLLKGRTFSDRDRVGQPKVVVVSETAARSFWLGEDPIGKHIRLGQGGFYEGDGAEVIGVVADVRYRSVEATPRADAYIPLLQSPRGGGTIFVRSSLDLSALVPALRADVQKLDPDLPVTNIKSMGKRFGDATWRTRLSADLLGLFAALALLLAAIGLYGVMSQGVAQRTREIGVRMALGADRARIFRLVIGRALIIGSCGVAAGVGLSLLSMPLLDALLYQVKANDTTTILTLALVLIAVTLLASYIPARRATRVDPLTGLRAE